MRHTDIERFRDELGLHYGAHFVSATGERPSCARLQSHSVGAFSIGVASGRYVTFSRARPTLADAWQDSIFLVQQVSGRSRVIHYDRSVDLHAGDVAVMDTQGSCTFDFSTGPTRQISLALPRSDLQDVVKLIRTTSRWAVSSRVGMGHALAALVSSVNACGTAFDAEDQRLICETLAMYVRRCLTAAPSEAPVSDERLFRRLGEWAAVHVVGTEVTPAALAREIGVSRRQLYRLFEAQSTTPAAWIWSLRLEAASRLLATNTDMSVTDVAFAVGFKDAAHFSRAFRRRFGYSPAARRPAASRARYSIGRR